MELNVIRLIGTNKLRVTKHSIEKHKWQYMSFLVDLEEIKTTEEYLDAMEKNMVRDDFYFPENLKEIGDEFLTEEELYVDSEHAMKQFIEQGNFLI